MSIFGKFSLAVGLAVLVAVGSVSFFSMQSHRKSLTREAVLRGESIAINLAAASSEALITGDPVSLITLALAASQDHEDVVYAAILDKNDVVQGHDKREMLGKKFELQSTQEVPGFSASVTEAMVEKHPIWDIEVAVIPKGTDKRLGSVHLGLSKEGVEKTIRESIRRALVLAALVLVGSIFMVFLIVKLLVRPIQGLSMAASEVGKGNFKVQLEVPSKDEIGQLVGHFNSMVANLESAQRDRLEKERMQGELNVANRIQLGLLPDEAPDRKDLEVAFSCEPAKELGGDFFDWFEIDKGKKLGFVIADVSGKGVPAALHMANVRNLVRFVVSSTHKPGEVLKKVNAMAWPDLKGESFVTVLYLVLDPRNGDFQMACAGHDPALKIKKSGKVEKCGGKGMPIGIAEAKDFDPVVKDLKGKLAKGESLVLYTDGITEAMDGRKNQFGTDRLEKNIAKGGSAKKIMEHLLEAVKKHAKGVEQSDDITCMVIKRV